MRTTPNLLAMTLALVLGVAAAASAQTAPADGQTPPAEEQKPLEPQPVPDPGTTPQSNCIKQDTEFTGSGRRILWVMTFENKCEARLRCRVFGYSVNARGPAQGRGTVTLGPKSAGAAAKKTFSMRVKGAGGMSSSARECRVF